MKISRAFVQRKRISDSCNCTCFPGLLPRTTEHDRDDKCISMLSLLAVKGRIKGRGTKARFQGRGLQLLLA
jgi:hypothetical protein